MRDLFAAVPLSGSLLNALAVLIGGSAGAALGRRLPERVGSSLLHALGVFSICLGIGMAGSAGASLTTLFSLIAGTAIGEALRLKERLERLGDLAKARLKLSDSRFTDAFVTSSLVFCVGSMAILGSIEQGLGAFPSILAAKSLMDGTSSTVFGATLGPGAVCAALSVLVYQGALTLAAGAAQSAIPPEAVDAMTSVGGLTIICIGLNLTGAAKINTAAQLPAIPIAAIAAALQM